MNEPVIPQATEAEERQILHSLRLSRIVFPVLLGLIAVAFLFYWQFDLEQFRKIEWTTAAFFWIGVAVALLVLRHFFIAFRLYAITRRHFTFRKCLELIVLWEFSSALTPTSKGGPFVMLFVLTREKLPAGRTAAAVFYTMALDSGFFVVTLPVLLLAYGPIMLFPGMQSYQDVGLASSAFFGTYALMVVYWLMLVFLLILRPKYARSALYWLAARPWLKRWALKLQRLGNEFERASEEIRQQNWRYHLTVMLATVASWTSKFIMINLLIIALVPAIPLDGSTQAFIYARLVAMFTIMTFSPTPGGAGLAEVALAGFISDFVPPGIGIVVALLWRGMAYYGYLLLGAFVVPPWIARQYRPQ